MLTGVPSFVNKKIDRTGFMTMTNISILLRIVCGEVGTIGKLVKNLLLLIFRCMPACDMSVDLPMHVSV